MSNNLFSDPDKTAADLFKQHDVNTNKGLTLGRLLGGGICPVVRVGGNRPLCPRWPRLRCLPLYLQGVVMEPSQKRDLHIGWWIAAAIVLGILIALFLVHSGME
jgi:hypothetical protein